MPITLPSFRQILDTDGTKPWASITEVFMADTGFVSQRTITYDDGLVREYQYGESGQVTKYVLRDSTDNLLPIERLTIEYGADGSIAKRVVEFDTGVRDTFTNPGFGSTRFMEDVDDAFAWSTRTLNFNNDGDLSSRAIEFDTGARITTFFEEFDGLEFVSTTRRDGDDNAFTWSSVSKLVVDGVLERREITYDSGLVIEEGPTEEGGLRFKLAYDGTPDGDPSDAFIWNTNLRVFDAEGNKQARVLTYDDGDAIANVFADDGSITNTLTFNAANFDGEPLFGDADDVVGPLDEEITWLFQLESFDATGAVVSTQTFDSLAELLDAPEALAVYTTALGIDGSIEFLEGLLPSDEFLT